MGKKRITHEEFLNRISGRKITCISKYESCNAKMNFKCDIDGFEWSAVPSSILAGHGCPECGRKKDRRKRNNIIADHGSWLELDASCDIHPNAIVKIDKDIDAKLQNQGFGSYGSFVTRLGSTVYSSCSKGYKTFRLHRVIVNAKKGEIVDHINGDGLDNRLCNLRICTTAQNAMNRKRLDRRNTSGKTGVFFDKRLNKWHAYISMDGHRTNIGYFNSLDEAIRERKNAEKKFYKEFSP